MSATRRTTTHRWLLAALALATLVTTSFGGAPADVDSGGGIEETRRPGVYVQEIPGTAGIVGVETGVPMLVGAGTLAVQSTRPTADDGPVQISSVADFEQFVDDPSPALDRAVADFFDHGGVQAMVAVTSSEDALTITSALDTVATWKGWDLLVAPALGALPSAEWLPTAKALAASAAQADAVALLDPPSDAVASAPADGGAALTALAQQLRATSDAGAATMYSSGLYSSGLVDGADESPVATAPVAAGVIAATDAEVGPWGQPGGAGHPIDDVTPGLTVDNALAATFNEAGITPVMTLPGFGTVLMGTRTLSQQPDQEYLSTVRTVGFLERSIELALQQYVFDPNDGATWSTVTTDVSQFLTGVWQEGGLTGAAASDSFSVEVGLGTTMSAQDILDGYMVVQVVLELGGPARTIDLTFSQVMQGV